MVDCLNNLGVSYIVETRVPNCRLLITMQVEPTIPTNPDHFAACRVWSGSVAAASWQLEGYPRRPFERDGGDAFFPLIPERRRFGTVSELSLQSRPASPPIPGGPDWSDNRNHVIDGRSVRFLYFSYEPGPVDDASVTSAVRHLGTAKEDYNVNYNTGRRWMQDFPPNPPNSYTIFGMYNLNDGHSEWVGLQNSADNWWFKKKGGGFEWLGNGGTLRHEFSITPWSKGELAFTNPHNTGGWTPDHFIFEYRVW